MRRGIRSVTLKHLNPSGKFPSGNVRYYYRPKGKKGIAMPDLPIDHPGFLAAYAEAHGSKPRTPVISGSLAAAVQGYKASDQFRIGLAKSTQANRRPMLDEIADTKGFGAVKDLRAKHIEKDLGRFEQHARNNHLKMWRAFCAWMVDHYKLDADPSDGIKRSKTPKVVGHEAWSEEDVAAFRAYWPIGTMERLAFELIFWTGARVSDAVRLSAGMIDRDGFLTFKQQKTGGEVFVPFERELPEFADAFAEDLRLLKLAINARNERHMTWMHTARGTSRSPKAVSQWFAAKARKAGIKGKTAHGLRKSRSEALVEAGATTRQVSAWIGHKSLSEIEHYTEKFNRRKALMRTEQEQKVPTSPIQFQKEV